MLKEEHSKLGRAMSLIEERSDIISNVIQLADKAYEKLNSLIKDKALDNALWAKDEHDTFIADWAELTHIKDSLLQKTPDLRTNSALHYELAESIVFEDR